MRIRREADASRGLTQCGRLGVEELQQHVLEDGQSGGGEGAGRHGALLVHHLRVAAPLRSAATQDAT